MDKKEHLEIGMNLAINFLYIPIEETKFSPMVVMHPIFESAIISDGNGKLFNALEDNERYREYQKEFENKIKKCQSLSEIVLLIRKSYRLTYISFLLDWGIDKVTCANLLAEQWTTIETLTYDVNVKPKRVLSIIKKADKQCLMDKEEMKIFNSLNDELTIYRGCKTKQGVKACSWSLSKEKAELFAHRFGKGFVFEAKIKKKDVIAYKNDRSEKEIIADYTKLYDIREYNTKKGKEV